MLTITSRLHCGPQVSLKTYQVTPFEVRHSQEIARNVPGCELFWQPVDTERFQLVAAESVKVGTPVNRSDALYWIAEVRARALDAGEVVGWVGCKVEENTGALAPVGQ